MSGTQIYSRLCQGKDRQQEQECEKCVSSLTFMKVRQQTDIITTANMCKPEATRAKEQYRHRSDEGESERYVLYKYLG